MAVALRANPGTDMLWQFACLVLILIEVFYIFFASSDLASFLFGEMLLMIEVLAILSGFTVVRAVLCDQERRGSDTAAMPICSSRMWPLVCS